MVDHLKANEIDVASGTLLTLGADLQFDVATESVTNHEQANEMMSREYRPDYEVPNIQSKTAS